MKKEDWLLVVLGLATAATIVTEILVVGQNTTKIELSLFGIIQFMFSLAFAWYLSKRNFQDEFEKQQRKFAIAAFRRIKEIESQTNRLIGRIEKSLTGSPDNYRHGLDLAKTLAQSLNETAMSSKLDWADVIGDQIETLEKIENIQGDFTASESNGKSSENESSYVLYVNELKKNLSNELKLYSNEKKTISDVEFFRRQLEKDESIRLRGFVDANWNNVRSPNRLEIGEELTVRLADEGERVASLAAYDKDNNYVGSFIKNSPGSYSDFTRAVCKAMGSSEFVAEVVALEKTSSSEKRVNFKAVAKPKNA